MILDRCVGRSLLFLVAIAGFIRFANAQFETRGNFEAETYPYAVAVGDF